MSLTRFLFVFAVLSHNRLAGALHRPRHRRRQYNPLQTAQWCGTLTTPTVPFIVGLRVWSVRYCYQGAFDENFFCCCVGAVCMCVTYVAVVSRPQDDDVKEDVALNWAAMM